MSSVLQVNSCVHTLDLADNGIPDEGGAALGSILMTNGTIEYLDLTDNAIQLAGCTALAAALAPKVSNLSKLMLRHNGIGDKECAVLARGLENNSTLTVLDLSHNCIGERGAAALGAMLSQNAGLEVRHTVTHDAAGCRALGISCKSI